MKLRKAFRCTAVLLSLVFVQAAAVSAGGPAVGQSLNADVDFRWAFASQTTVGGKQTITPITQDTALKSGDQIKMMIEPQRRCFVYVFHYNQRDGLKLLFPYSLQQFSVDYQVKQKYYVPRGEAWFKLDNNTGKEVFYLLSSATRLEDLEKTYMQYESTAGPAKAEAANAVIDRIRTLRREHMTTPAERPVPIGGAVRGIDQAPESGKFDIASFADEVLSTGFVARTFTIEHQ
jgi:hypothetical protein